MLAALYFNRAGDPFGHLAGFGAGGADGEPGWGETSSCCMVWRLRPAVRWFCWRTFDLCGAVLVCISRKFAQHRLAAQHGVQHRVVLWLAWWPPFYARVKRLHFWPALDALTPGLVFALIVMSAWPTLWVVPAMAC